MFVPAYAIAASGLMPEFFAIPAGVIVVVTGAIYFADRKMKTDDNYFRGFPAVWNLAAFYLYVLQPPEWIAAAGVVVLAALSFVPIKFLHPLRVRHWRWLNVALLALWAVLALRRARSPACSRGRSSPCRSPSSRSISSSPA